MRCLRVFASLPLGKRFSPWWFSVRLGVLLAVLGVLSLHAGQPLAGVTPQDAAALSEVGRAVLNWDGQSPVTLAERVRQLAPDVPVIETLRLLNLAQQRGQLARDVGQQFAQIEAKQRTYQGEVRQAILEGRRRALRSWIGTPQGRSLSAIGDSGSWPDPNKPVEIRSDFDFTIFGADVNINRQVRDACGAAILETLGAQGFQLRDFDVVVTAEGAEVESHVFETQGGIDWARRNLKRIELIYPDGTTRPIELWRGDPAGELAYASMMARLRHEAARNGDYDRMFDARGFLRESVFNDTSDGQGQTLWERYRPILEGLGVDYFRSQTSTAPGGCLDMARHLRLEVLDVPHLDARARLKRMLKYLPRAHTLAQAAPGVGQLIADDPLLSDPAYTSLLSLARAVDKATPAELDILLRQHFGDYPDAGLQELGNRLTEMILRYSEVAYQAEIDRIILQEPTPERRRQALDRLENDFRIIEGMGGSYAEHARAARQTIEKVRQAEADGTINALRQQRLALERIRQAEAGKKNRLKQLLELTELGQELLKRAGQILDIGRILPPAEGRYRSGTVDLLTEIGASARAQGLKVVDYLGSASMWAGVLNSITTAQSDVELVMALSRTLVENTFFGMVFQSLYAFKQGDNTALLRAVMYLLVPETALPALVEALGETVITLGAQTLFDQQLDRLYAASRFDDQARLVDLGGLGVGGVPGARQFVDAMCDGEAEAVAQDFIHRSKATEFGSGANHLAILALTKAIQATINQGRPGLFTQDGPLMRACAGTRKVNDDLTDLSKMWGVELPQDATTAGAWASSLDRGQRRALDTLLAARESWRQQARQATAEAIVRTFEERRAAELALDTDRGRKAVEQYERLQAMFKALEITDEGTRSLEAEGAPYSVIKGWLMSDREKQVAAVKAIQKFLRVYEGVVQARDTIEGAMVSRLGRVVRPRPLTRSLPLTAKPELDADLLRRYITDIAKAEASATHDLELIKRARLEGDYDAKALQQLYDYRAQITHWSVVMAAATAAQDLRWKFEVFEKQRLRQQFNEASEEVTRLRELERTLLDKFRAYYTLGEAEVRLIGPAEVEVGQEVPLRCTVRVRKPQADGTSGEWRELPPDLAKQVVYDWRVAGASLGTDRRAERTYRLQTPGPQAYSVTVKRPREFGGDDVLGTATWTVTVKAPTERKPTDAAKPPDTPPPDPPPAGMGKGRFAATAAGNWEGGNTKDGLVLTRKPAVIKGPCGWESRVTATVQAYIEPVSTTDELQHPQAIRAWAEKILKDRPQGDVPSDMSVGLFKGGGIEGVSSLKIGAFDGALADFAVWIRRGSWGSGYTGSYLGASGKGQATGKLGRLVVRYSVSGGGCWDNSDRAYLVRQVEAAQREAKAIIASLQLDPNGQLTTTNYQGPKYDGSDLPRVTLVPGQVRKLRVGERVTVRAVVENAEPGDAPYTYTWQGDIEGDLKKAGDTVVLKPKSPGKFTLSVAVGGARYGLGSAALDYEVADIRVVVEPAPVQNQGYILGRPQGFLAKLTVDGKPAGGSYTFRWQPHPEVQFAPFESGTPNTQAVFTRPGATKLWVEVLESVDGVLTTVAVSPQLDLSVTAPKFELKPPDAVLVGQEAVVTLTETPPLPEGMARYWWEATPNAAYGTPVNRDRAYRFKPKDTKPVTLTAHVQAQDGGDEIGVATCEVTARAFNVVVRVLGPDGPPPQVWKPGVGLVPVERAIVTHQYVTLRADVSPAVPDGGNLRYEWLLNPDSHLAGGGIGAEVRAYRSQVGTCEATVIVRNAEGIELGRGQGTFEVTLDRGKLDASNKAAEAAEKLAQARTAHAAGRLDEAITLATAAAALSPQQREAATLAERWRQDKALIHQHLQTCEQFLGASRFEDAKAAFEKAKAIHALYPPVAEMEKRLTAAVGSRATRIKQALDRVVALNAAKQYSTALATVYRLRKELSPLSPGEEAQVRTLEAAARAGEAEKERVRERLRRGEARFNAYDYTGALAELMVIFEATCFAADDPEPEHYRKLGNEAAARLERINALLPKARAVADNPRATRTQIVAALRDVEEVLRLQPPNQEAQDCKARLTARLTEDNTTRPPVGGIPPPSPPTSPPVRPPAPPPATVSTIFNNGNIAAVDNGPTRPTRVTFNRPCVVTYVTTYHWNYGRGARPGTVGLLHSSGKLYGPWQMRGTPGQGGVPNANWECTPNVVVPAGTYTVVDSDPATWAQNSGSGGAGMAVVKGYPAEAGGRTPPTNPPDNPAGGGRQQPPPTNPPVSPPISPPGGGMRQPPPSSQKVIEAVFKNASSDPVHICLAGEDFGPENRVGPGETRRVRVAIPADAERTGRIKFVAGRNGQVIATGMWDYDPSAPSRYPVVTFPDEDNPFAKGKLVVTTGLR